MGVVPSSGCQCDDLHLRAGAYPCFPGRSLCFDVGQKTWKSYDWSQITTVAVFGKYDPELMCYAHSKGARVVLKGDVSLKDIIDPTVRAAWVAQKVDLAKTQYMDGINLDIEQEVNCSSPEYEALTALVKETTEHFHREIEGSQVNVHFIVGY
ncbi:di-N-acetylchitobiase-like [Acomys russatus]|uniref:di-N-acetylchitobiase-like n=1 Tax=Acomys russatus TaxID=60746 RepID=UPI0021E2B3F4|nr:di-N-acetylchitobiase-like [Acomys russatus]